MSFNREYIGNVKVVSGKLLITDPGLSGLAPDAEAEVKRVIHTVEGAGLIREGAAVAFITPSSDGEYPVFVSYNEHGDITGVEIRMDEAGT